MTDVVKSEVLEERKKEIQAVISARTSKAQKRDVRRRGISWQGRRTEGPVRVEEPETRDGD